MGLTNIAIIPDGNRRFSKKYKISMIKSYQKGIEQVFNVSKYFFNLGVKEISFFGFSKENWKRNKFEINLLHSLFLKNANNFLKKKQKENVRIKFIGNLEEFKKPLKDALLNIEKKTLSAGGKSLNLLLNYSAKDEIVQAVHKCKNCSVESLQNNLWVKNDVDLLVRTGGFQRDSDFLIWQSGYAERYYEDKLWGELTEKDVRKIYQWFSKQKRNFGR